MSSCLVQLDMIEIRYSDKNEIDISGTPSELLELKQKIFRMVDSNDGSVLIEAASNFAPLPFDAVAQRMIVARAECPTIAFCDWM